MRCHKNDKKWFRIGESCKNKFEKLALLKKPTGTAEIPLNVLRAKEIKDKISSNEVIGYCEENESDFDGVCDAEDNLDSVTVCKSLAAANLSDTSGEVKRPETNKQKAGKLAEAIKDLGDRQKKQLLDYRMPLKQWQNRYLEIMAETR